jgi:biopolymer transport protein ExbD
MHIEKGSKAVHYEAGPDMTPLVDVVMVLLIFLMMAGKFGGQIKYLVSEMPITQTGPSAAPADPTKIPKQDIVLNVTSPAGAVDTFRAFYGRAVNADNEETLTAQLKKLLEEQLAAGTKLEDIQLFIKPTRNVIYSNVVRVYAAAGRAGFTNIGFQTADG